MTDTALLATFASRLLFHWRASQGPTSLPTTIEASMAHTGVSPHQVAQLEKKALQTENENLRLKYGQALQLIQQQTVAINTLRIGMAALVLEQGGRVEIARATLAEIQTHPTEYELGETNDPAEPVLVLTAGKKDATAPADQEPPTEPPASSLIIASR